MELLPFSRRFCNLCGVCAPPEGSDFAAKLRQMITVVFIFVSTQVMELGFIMYALYQLEMGNIFNLLFAVLHVAASNAARLSYITVIPQSKNLRDLFNGMQTILNQCKFRKESKFLQSTIYLDELSQFSHSRTFTVGEAILFQDKWTVWQNSKMDIDHRSKLLCDSSTYYFGVRSYFLLRSWWTRWTTKFVHAIENAVLIQVVGESKNSGQ